jgi:glycosyltransferase involved in cell wall biosynthesis
VIDFGSAEDADARARHRASPYGSSPVHAVHVIAGLDPIYGGPSYSVPRLCQALTSVGAEPSLLSVAPARASACEIYRQGYRDRRFAHDYARIPILRQLRCSSGLAAALRALPPQVDVIHGHGLWLVPNIQLGWAAAASRKPLVVSPRGMLSPAALRFSRLKKRAFWHLAQGAVLRGAACIHATSEQEGEEIRAVGLINPIAIIPNGIDLPPLGPKTFDNPSADRIVLSLGRIHPKKGLEGLLHAWAAVEARHPDWRLRIAGPSEAGHADWLRGLGRTLGLTRIEIAAPVFGDAKWQAYRSAELFVLPTLNENFGLVVAEALAAGTPVISTKGAPWARLEHEGCGWWVEHGTEPLAAALESAMAMPRTSLKRMGTNGRAWMAREFSWERFARDLLEVYRWLAWGDALPTSVHFD